ncbi:MAG: Fe-S protein assembly co-chaperone HscB, partial [Betaproteobacteria bacterium]|nr:Fe-S protein assembly co-chaperone HscB [Betaproteobacteria bacterium]
MNPSTSDLAWQGRVQLHSNSFQIFGLPRSFAIDKTLLTERFHQLMQAVHPDRHATAAQADRRQAMQWASRVNQAYRDLMHPLTRAQLLCALAGAPFDRHNSQLPTAFLMQQMQWREDLECISETLQASDAACRSVAASTAQAQRLQALERVEMQIRQAIEALAESFAQSSVARGEAQDP